MIKKLYLGIVIHLVLMSSCFAVTPRYLTEPQIISDTGTMARDVGYVMGDVIPRIFVIEFPSDAEPDLTVLPRTGRDAKGLEVRSVFPTKTCEGLKCRLTVRIDYQIFTSKVVAKPAILPAEWFRFRYPDNKWHVVRSKTASFRISPLAVFGNVKLPDDLSPDALPPIPDSSDTKLKTVIGLLTLFMGIVVTMWVNGWTPRFNKKDYFAQAYKKIKALDPENGLEAITILRQATNQSLGRVVFDEDFKNLETIPLSSGLKKALEEFYSYSASFLFENRPAGTTLYWKDTAERLARLERWG